MDYFGWQESLDTGIGIIDSQHKEIAMYLNGVYQAVCLKLPHEEQAAMRELIESVRSHLSFEEELLEAAGYPGLEAHRRSHSEFRRRLERYFAAFLEGHDVSLAIIAELRIWLSNHILHDDLAFVPHLRQQLSPVEEVEGSPLPFMRLLGKCGNSHTSL